LPENALSIELAKNIATTHPAAVVTAAQFTAVR
jgi:hypothetical protein